VPGDDQLNVGNYGKVYQQNNTQNNYYSGSDPAHHLAAARQALKRHDWDAAIKHFEEHVTHARDTASTVLVEYALAELRGKRPREHAESRLEVVRARLDSAYRGGPALPFAAALLAIIDEDLDHLHRHEPELFTRHLAAVATSISPEEAKLIVEAIRVEESPTWVRLARRVHPSMPGKFFEATQVDEEQRREREFRMRTLFARPPRKPPPPYRLSHGAAGTGLCLCLAALTLSLGFLRNVPYAWSPLSPLPYVTAVAIAGAVGCLAWLVTTAVRNNAQARHHAAEVERYNKECATYRGNLPTIEQIDGWLRGDLEAIQRRALERLGITRDELVTRTGRYISPLVIMGPEERRSTRTRMARHPSGRFFSSRYGVFVLFMTEKKLGAYRTTLDAVTGRRETAEQTSEYRYGDIVSVSVRTVPLSTPKKKHKEAEQEEADDEYSFVDAESTPKVPIAERFTLIVPSDRFDVTTTVRDENSATDYRIQLSQTDQALAAIRRNILTSGAFSRATT
ncbi:hypothetical protein JYK22_05930, partial [Nonomuraea sp. RK-328]|nr:hypothetical protein [Nonomuraea sp. RK-328]